MTDIMDLLRDADPLPTDMGRLVEERGRLRRAVIAAASEAASGPTTNLSTRRAALAAAATVAVGTMAGTVLWRRAGTPLQAAVRFEVRLAEVEPVPGYIPARVSGSDRIVYLHPESVAGNADVLSSRAVATEEAGPFNVHVAFTPDAARRIRLATTGHIGRPVAVLIDGEVVMAPVLRSVIANAAVISGAFSRDEAERIAAGIGVH